MHHSPPQGPCLPLGQEGGPKPLPAAHGGTLASRQLWEHAPPRGGWPLGRNSSPENEDCGSPGFMYCRGAGMWKRHSQMENGRTWVESQSTPHTHSLTRHSSSAHLLPPSSASLAPAALWRERTHVHTHAYTHMLGGKSLDGGVVYSGLFIACGGTHPPLSSTQTPAGILRPPKKLPVL